MEIKVVGDVKYWGGIVYVQLRITQDQKNTDVLAAMSRVYCSDYNKADQTTKTSQITKDDVELWLKNMKHKWQNKFEKGEKIFDKHVHYDCYFNDGDRGLVECKEFLKKRYD